MEIEKSKEQELIEVKRQLEETIQKLNEAESKLQAKTTETTVKDELHIKQLTRKERLDAWNEYIGFLSSKTFGLLASIIGGLEFFTPNVLSIELKNPEQVMGAGLALLIGGKIIEIFSVYFETKKVTK